MVKLQVRYSDNIWVAHIDDEFFNQDPDLKRLNKSIQDEMDRRIASRDTHERRKEQ